MTAVLNIKEFSRIVCEWLDAYRTRFHAVVFDLDPVQRADIVAPNTPVRVRANSVELEIDALWEEQDTWTEIEIQDRLAKIS